MIWAIQTNKIKSSQSLSFIEALTKFNLPWAEVSIDFDGNFNFDHGIQTRDVIPYGSVTLIRTAEREGWKHVFTNDNFQVDVWNMNHPQMLNSDVYINTLSEAARNCGDLFGGVWE